MILTVQQRFELDLPTNWRELPPASVMATSEWLFEWTDEAPIMADRKGALAKSLADAAAFALEKMNRSRTWVAIIDPNLGLVRAMASITTIELSDDIFPYYSVIASPEIPVDGAISWVNTDSDAVLAGEPAIIVHGIGAYPSADGAVMAERYVGTLFPDAGSTAVQLEILAEDLESFRDIVASGNAVLAGLRFAVDLD